MLIWLTQQRGTICQWTLSPSPMITAFAFYFRVSLIFKWIGAMFLRKPKLAKVPVPHEVVLEQPRELEIPWKNCNSNKKMKLRNRHVEHCSNDVLVQTPLLLWSWPQTPGLKWSCASLPGIWGNNHTWLHFNHFKMCGSVALCIAILPCTHPHHTYIPRTVSSSQTVILPIKY